MGDELQGQPEGELDPRVPLALERTFLAWVRTGLAMMGFGFVVARFGLFLRELEAVNRGEVRHGHVFSMYTGTALILMGVVVTFYASVLYRRSLAAALRGEWPVSSSTTVHTLVAMALCAVGGATIWYLLSV